MERLTVEDVEEQRSAKIRLVAISDERRVYASHVLSWDDDEHKILRAMVTGYTMRTSERRVWRWQWKLLVAFWGFVVSVAVIIGAVAGLVAILR